MSKKKLGLNTICAHVGEIKDEQFKGAVSPIYLSSSYEFIDVDVKRYPRYFNTPNQEYLAKKFKKEGIIPSCKQENFKIEKLNKIDLYKGFTNYSKKITWKELFGLF